MSMKFKDLSVKNNIPKIILLVAGIISAIFLQWASVPIIFACYILLSLIYKNNA
jgi:CDP-diacylglycerol--serine O-phosphatidyltransferase